MVGVGRWWGGMCQQGRDPPSGMHLVSPQAGSSFCPLHKEHAEGSYTVSQVQDPALLVACQAGMAALIWSK